MSNTANGYMESGDWQVANAHLLDAGVTPSHEAGALVAETIRKDMIVHGVFVVRGLLAPDEIAEAHAQVRAYLQKRGRRYGLGKTQPNAAALAPPEIGLLVGHPKVVSVFKMLLDKPVFTGHCDIHMNMLSGWHKDSGEHVGGYFSGNYFVADDCRVYKAAIYLQPTGEGEGLHVQPWSHWRPQRSPDKIETIEAQPGDVLFFDVRLTHAGQMPDRVEKLLKAVQKIVTLGSRTRQDPLPVYWAKKLYWKMSGHKDRLSVFFTYGEDNHYTQEFAEANMGGLSLSDKYAIAGPDRPAREAE